MTRRTSGLIAPSGAVFSPGEIGGTAVRSYPKSPLNHSGTAFYKFKVGDIEIYQIFDGANARDIAPGQITNVTVDDIKAALIADGFSGEKLPNTYTVTVIRIGSKLIMFDSGNGEGGHPASGHLQENMRAAGLAPEDISAIVVTHFHPDHIYGLMTKTNEQVYPDTEILVPATEYAYWTDAGNNSQMQKARVPLAERIQATFPTWRNINRYEAGEDVIPGIRAIATPGHSPGHTSLLLSSGKEQLMVTADITNIPTFNMTHPDWHLAADQDAEMAAQTRHKILGQLAADKMLCTGYHWGLSGAGVIEAHGDGYKLISLD